jgi:hypothetical protein
MEAIMSRSRPEKKGEFTRKEPKTKTPAAGASADQAGRREKLPPEQAQAIKSLEFGTSAAGREFKEHGSEPDRPVVNMRPPMPNESTRTDMDRHGTGGYRGKN